MRKHLYEVFADKWYHGGSIWFYSDPHFGDAESYSLRFPYWCRKVKICDTCDGSHPCPKMTPALVKKLDEFQVRQINSKVGKNDTIIILGDIGDIEYVKKIRGRKVLIMGNHEAGASNYIRVIEDYSVDGDLVLFTDEYEHDELIAAGYHKEGNDYFKHVDNHLFDEVYEGPLIISDRIVLSHEPVNFGDFFLNIHGHVHGKYSGNDAHHLNVAAEHIGFTPISLSSIIDSGKLKHIKNIHRDYLDAKNEEIKRKKSE